MSARPNKAVSPKGKQRLESIIKTAKSVLALEGYENFTLRKIAQKANISLAAIQHYFSSKEMLLNAVIDHELDMYNDEWSSISSQFSSPEEKLEAFLDLLFGLHLDIETSSFMFQFWSLSSTNPKFHDKISVFYQGFQDKLISIQKEISPALSDAEIQNRSLVIISIVEGTLILVGGNRCILSTADHICNNAKNHIFAIVKQLP